jgi:hypothetical protein
MPRCWLKVPWRGDLQVRLVSLPTMELGFHHCTLHCCQDVHNGLLQSTT